MVCITSRDKHGSRLGRPAFMRTSALACAPSACKAGIAEKTREFDTMMRKIRLLKVIITVLSLNIMTLPVSAQTTVEEIIPACNAAVDDSLIVRRPAGFCIGFVTGVWYMMNMNCINEDFREVIPPEFQAGYISSWRAMVQTFLNWAEDHPESWEELAFVGIFSSLSSTFPCE